MLEHYRCNLCIHTKGFMHRKSEDYIQFPFFPHKEETFIQLRDLIRIWNALSYFNVTMEGPGTISLYTWD